MTSRLHTRPPRQVNDDPAALLRLYQEVGQVPDIWNLTEWSDWLLPAYRERAGQRYANAPVKKAVLLLGCCVVVGYVSTNQLKKYGVVGNVLHTLIKKKIKFSSYIRKSEWSSCEVIYD